uniref:Uncharacterized protein n=1 Tax=Phasianus colchicus TaxID=9054 RepID=A0A669P6V5_PHACC
LDLSFIAISEPWVGTHWENLQNWLFESSADTSNSEADVSVASNAHRDPEGKKKEFGEVVPFWLALIFIVGSIVLSGVVATNRYNLGCPGNRETGFVTWYIH